ncbi:E3 ubiquitin-protein ligase RNF31 isoform X3 [Labrus bergylta]|uniref:E3 ubiquitin-protein ligase RNF31 isoform X3 n=1 Tax=Labrus bergylta TaxID=56723 RepID=UPI003313D6A2
MSRVRSEAELRTLNECEYRYPVEALSDVRSVRSLFPDLRLYVDFYCFPNKDKKRLLYLAGTLPVHFEGSVYNIPVCIWLHETHPLSRPRCYVCPSVTMVINPACPSVDASGNISLDGLRNWTYGVSTLSLLVSEMKRAFQKDTPLYARNPVPVPPPTGVQVAQSAGSLHHCSSSSSGLRVSQWEQSREVRVRRSYTEELLGIDFSAPPQSTNNPFIIPSPSSGVPPVDPLSGMMGALRLESVRERLSDSPVRTIQSGAHRLTADQDQVSGPASGPNQSLQPDHIQMTACLNPDQAAIFLSLMTMEGRSFSPDDVIEAIQLNRDFSSALKFLTHCCPICQEQVSFSKIITMTHCSCFLCQMCFKTFFSAAIKEKSIDQLVCPQCGRPEVKGHSGMDYFNLLDTQIRHFLPPQIHELFQRKLRDRALQEMPNFCWCAHWSSQHQGLSCQQFRVWKQQNHLDQNPNPTLSYNSIECPSCQCVFSVSKGGCLHFTCSQCQHQFCGGCSRTFSLGSACSFSADCGSKGLHAHHPRDCLYHLRDWSVPRLHLLLQYYRASPAWLEPANGSSPDNSLTGVCLILELKDDGSRREEPCGRPAHPDYRGYCQLHYKENLVELINRCHGDPAVLFSQAEMKAELQRWHVSLPTRRPEEPEQLYSQRLLLVSRIIVNTLTNSVPLRKQRLPAQTEARPLPSALCCDPCSSAHLPAAQGLADSAHL